MFKIVAVSAFLLSASAAMAVEFLPEAGIPVGPTEIGGRVLDYQGLLPGIGPDEVKLWWEENYPGIALAEHSMKFQGNIAGAYVEMAPFINMLESPYGFASSEVTKSEARFFFNGWAGGNQLLGYQFATRYDSSALPEYDAVRAALIAKYGEPTSFAGPGGTETLSWAYKDGQPVDCGRCGLPLYSVSPYNAEWFSEAFYRIENFDFALSVSLRRENMSSRSSRIENLRVQSMDTRKTREGLDADMAALTAEGERLAAIAATEKEARPATEVRF